MNKPLIYIPLLLLLVIVLIEVVIYFTKPSFLFSPSQTVEKITESVASSESALPISPKESFIKAIDVNYRVRTTITEIKKEKGKVKLFTDLKSKELPPAIIDNSTKLFTFMSGKREPAIITDFEVGRKVDIALQYNMAKKTWKTTGVSLLRENNVPLSPTESSSM